MVILRMVDGSGWNIGEVTSARDAYPQPVKGKVVCLERGFSPEFGGTTGGGVHGRRSRRARRTR
jgi:hypothetical protein